MKQLKVTNNYDEYDDDDEEEEEEEESKQTEVILQSFTQNEKNQQRWLWG